MIPDHAAADEMQQIDGAVLRQLMSQLPTEQSQVIYLAFFHGLSHSEIAEQTAIPLGTIKTRLRLAMQKLKQMWSAQVELPHTNEELPPSGNPRTRN